MHVSEGGDGQSAGSGEQAIPQPHPRPQPQPDGHNEEEQECAEKKTETVVEESVADDLVVVVEMETEKLKEQKTTDDEWEAADFDLEIVDLDQLEGKKLKDFTPMAAGSGTSASRYLRASGSAQGTDLHDKC